MRIKKLSLFLALMLAIGATVLPLTAYAAGGKDTTPPELTASLDGGTLKVESSDDNSGVEAVFVDGNRINSLTNGAAKVTLKDYAGTEKQVIVYAQDYAGNRSEAVKFDNPYYEEPKETEKPSAAPAQTGTVKPTQAPAASSGSRARPHRTTEAAALPIKGFLLPALPREAVHHQAIIPAIPAVIIPGTVPMRVQTQARQTAPGEHQAAVHHQAAVLRRVPLPLSRRARLPRRAPARS